jgi:hypothetical protein
VSVQIAGSGGSNKANRITYTTGKVVRHVGRVLLEVKTANGDLRMYDPWGVTVLEEKEKTR